MKLTITVTNKFKLKVLQYQRILKTLFDAGRTSQGFAIETALNKAIELGLEELKKDGLLEEKHEIGFDIEEEE